MKKYVFLLLVPTAMLSCNQDDDDIIKTESGNIWLSGTANTSR